MADDPFEDIVAQLDGILSPDDEDELVAKAAQAWEVTQTARQIITFLVSGETRQAAHLCQHADEPALVTFAMASTLKACLRLLAAQSRGKYTAEEIWRKILVLDMQGRDDMGQSFGEF